MGLFDYFKKISAEKRKKREEEKKKRVKAQLKKLAPYEKEINSNRDLAKYLIPWTIWSKVIDELKSDPKINLYDKIIELMITVDDEFIEENVAVLISALVLRSIIEKEYGNEIKSKIIEKVAWKGMTEPMFKSSLIYLSEIGKLRCKYVIEDESKANGINRYYKFYPMLSIPSPVTATLTLDKYAFIKEIIFKNDKLYKMVNLSDWAQKTV